MLQNYRIPFKEKKKREYSNLQGIQEEWARTKGVEGVKKMENHAKHMCFAYVFKIFPIENRSMY